MKWDKTNIDEKRASCCCSGHACEETRDFQSSAHGDQSSSGLASTERETPRGAKKARYRIENMDCPVEEQLIRAKLESIPGIVRLDFNLINRELTAYHHLDDSSVIVSSLEKLGMPPLELKSAASASLARPGLPNMKKVTLTIAGAAAVGAEVMAWITGLESSWLVISLAAVSLLVAGLPTITKGWIALKSFTLNIYFLMTLAVAGALALGKWPEASMVVFLFTLAEVIEGISLERARNAISALTELAPETAEVSSAGVWTEQPTETVQIGARIRIKAGSRVPLDSMVEVGRVSVDQSSITGESMPLDKQAGEMLYAGSIAVDGAAEASVSALAGDSMLARIADSVQRAQSQRAPTQRFIDRFARFYTPGVVVFAAAAAIIGSLLGASPWEFWLYQSLVMLVIACPCALVIATPVAVVSGLAAAARHGILIKGGAYLEEGRRLKAAAFDKTGTLTRGAPRLIDVIPFDGASPEQVLQIAASLDDHSTHPIAKALVAGCRSRRPETVLLSVDEFAVLEGRGVKGYVNGRLWYLGNQRLAEEIGLSSPELKERMAAMEQDGKTVIILCSNLAPAALFGMADTIRPESVEAIELLKNLGLETALLTGDNTTVARSVANELGISDVSAELLPEDKLDAIARLQSRHGVVAMVGDGVNDAPALACADIGVAMGASATAAALETADVAIMDDDTRKVASFIILSRRCVAILKQNIFLALGVKAVFLFMALVGKATLWMAVFADTGVSLLVMSNGLRLLNVFRHGKHESVRAHLR